MNLVLTVFAPFFPNGRITMYLLLLPERVFCNWLCSAVILSRRSSSSPTQIPTTAACGVISTLTAKQSVCSTIICRLRKSAATSANWKKNFVQTIPTVRNVPLSPLPMVCMRTSRNVPHKLNISIN